VPINDLEDHPVIEGVLVVPVPPPAAGPDVYFDVPSLENPAGGDNGVA
jgi:hypothetical protein